MKKIILICLAIFVFTFIGKGEEVLKNLLEGKKWEQLPTICLDESHKALTDYFSNARTFKVVAQHGNVLTYKAKFSSEGEIGSIVFEKKGDKYLKLEIRNQVKPLHFIEKFRKYNVEKIRLQIGDAAIHFISGQFYQAVPFESLLLFQGRWNITITPNDEEEKLTLKREYKKNYFSSFEKEGIFLLDDRTFLDKFTAEPADIDSEEGIEFLHRIYCDTYAFDIDGSGENWFLPLPRESNLIIFKKDKKSLYNYSYNPNMVPDTQLILSENKKMILSYNRDKAMKMFFGQSNSVSHVNLDIFFDPGTNLISGVTGISYKEPSPSREVLLDDGINLMRRPGTAIEDYSVFKKRGKYYLLGPESKRISLFFKGTFKPKDANFELFSSHYGRAGTFMQDSGDIFYFLSKIDNYYPNPGNDFFKSDLTIKLPAGLNCLASGKLVGKAGGATPTFQFSSAGTKGISLVAGNFKLSKKVHATPLLKFYTFDSFKYPRSLKFAEIKKAAELFNRSFGALDLPEVNILLKRGLIEGGLSNNGFIVLHLPPTKKQVNNTVMQLNAPVSIGQTLISPILIRERTEDYIIHELAHQWWGGVISWRSYLDVWLTEGLAHFSVLYYLKKNIPERRFNRIVKKLKRWVNRYSNRGPIIYGSRINLLEEDYEAYQSVIYNKSALVFLMLMDIIGEDDFMKRLRSVTEKYKYKSISSMQFIRQFSGDNKMIMKFFRKWVYSRVLPEVMLELVEDDPQYDHKNHKTIVLSVKQLETDFVFPFKLKVVSGKGATTESLIMTEKQQNYVIKRKSTIFSVVLQDSISPIREKKILNPSFKRK